MPGSLEYQKKSLWGGRPKGLVRSGGNHLGPHDQVVHYLKRRTR